MTAATEVARITKTSIRGDYPIIGITWGFRRQFTGDESDRQPGCPAEPSAAEESEPGELAGVM
jgi:hypothetical protein